MSSLKPLSEIFKVETGTNLVLADMEKCKKSDEDAINFVSRTDYNNGISAFVKKSEDIVPIKENTISVALSGSSVLASFYQPEIYYSGYHIGVLTPINEMTITEMMFYAACIKCNRYRYSFGRQANKTIGDLLVPSKMPDEYSMININNIVSVTNRSVIDKVIDLDTTQWKYYKLYYDSKKSKAGLFKISGTKTTPLLKLSEYGEGKYPYVTTQATNNGVEGLYDFKTENGNVLTVDSAVLGYCSYQPLDFSASDHVEKLTPTFEMNKYIAMFLVTIMNMEQYRYNYGRKASQSRMKQISIKLPTKNNMPDFEFMEDFIKTLPYSSCLEQVNEITSVSEISEDALLINKLQKTLIDF